MEWKSKIILPNKRFSSNNSFVINFSSFNGIIFYNNEINIFDNEIYFLDNNEKSKYYFFLK